MNTFEYKGNVNDYAGFVYQVTELSTGKRYIGLKHFFSKVKGKKIESDWYRYRTSNKHLKMAIKEFPDNYTFKILYLCKDETIMRYLEAKTIMECGALESDMYYNNNIKLNLNTTLKDFEERYVRLR